MTYIKIDLIVFSLSNQWDTLPDVGAGREIQDDVQDGCHRKKYRLEIFGL